MTNDEDTAIDALNTREFLGDRLRQIAGSAATPAAIARKRGLTFESQVSDTVQQVILQGVMGGQQRRDLNGSLNGLAGSLSDR